MDTNRPTDTPDDTSGSVYQDLLAEVDAMFDDDLLQATIDAKKQMDKDHARLLVLTDELDRRRVTEASHALSTTAWLRHNCRMTAAEASGTVKTARALAGMPLVAQEAVTGEIVSSGVKVLTRARDRHPDAFVDHEAVFADVATYLNPRDLRIAVQHWDQQVDYDAALEDVEHDAHRRELFFNQSYKGRWDMAGRFGVADGHVIKTALRGYIQHTYLDGDDRRSMPQRLADAEIGIHRFWLDHNETVATSGGDKPHITVVVPYDILTGTRKQLPELDGYAIDPETLRRWACDAGIVRIITDPDSIPIDVGRRTRTIPPALRRALELRDGGCVWPGCNAPASWADVHHIIHWADGGETSLNNTQLLCRRHHTTTHQNTNTKPPEP
ncbi:MAG: DUF222 domain-containing protein [Actinomycetota bacterium]